MTVDYKRARLRALCYTTDELFEALAVAERVRAGDLADEIRWAIAEHVIAEE